jgi:urocanate hydratase
MKKGVDNSMDYPGFVPAYIRELFCRGEGSFRRATLSGDPEDIRVTDRALLKLFPEKTKMINWLKMAGKKLYIWDCPSRSASCWDTGNAKRPVNSLMILSTTVRSRRPSSSAGTISTADRWHPPTGKPRP